MATIIGIDLGGTKTAVVRWAEGRLQHTERFPTAGPEETLARIEAFLGLKLARIPVRPE
jgi:predicted NBD/HSP70 family sugar kinase